MPHVELGQVVTTVAQDPEAREVSVATVEGGSVTAKRAVVALPLGVLKAAGTL